MCWGNIAVVMLWDALRVLVETMNWLTTAKRRSLHSKTQQSQAQRCRRASTVPFVSSNIHLYKSFQPLQRKYSSEWCDGSERKQSHHLSDNHHTLPISKDGQLTLSSHSSQAMNKVVYLKKPSENKISESGEPPIIYFKWGRVASVSHFLVVLEADVKKMESQFWGNFLNQPNGLNKRRTTETILKIKTGLTGFGLLEYIHTDISLNEQIIALKNKNFVPVISSSNLASDLRRCKKAVQITVSILSYEFSAWKIVSILATIYCRDGLLQLISREPTFSSLATN
jgi:hypothetical protein